MPKYLVIIFCKMYEWHTKYALSQDIAALRSAFFISFIILINLITVWWVIALLCNIPFKSFSPNFYLQMVIIPLLIISLYLYIYLVIKKKYLVLCKRNNVEAFHFFGLSKRGFTLAYIISSWTIFILIAIIYIRK